MKPSNSIASMAKWIVAPLVSAWWVNVIRKLIQGFIQEKIHNIIQEKVQGLIPA